MTSLRSEERLPFPTDTGISPVLLAGLAVSAVLHLGVLYLVRFPAEAPAPVVEEPVFTIIKLQAPPLPRPKVVIPPPPPQEAKLDPQPRQQAGSAPRDIMQTQAGDAGTATVQTRVSGADGDLAGGTGTGSGTTLGTGSSATPSPAPVVVEEATPPPRPQLQNP